MRVSVLAIIVSFFLCQPIHAAVLLGEEDNDPSALSNSCWSIKFPSGSYTRNADDTCSIDTFTSGGDTPTLVFDDTTTGHSDVEIYVDSGLLTISDPDTANKETFQADVINQRILFPGYLSCTALETDSSGTMKCGTDDTSVGGGNSIFFEHDGAAVGNNSSADITLDATTALDLTCVGQNCTVIVEADSIDGTQLADTLTLDADLTLSGNDLVLASGVSLQAGTGSGHLYFDDAASIFFSHKTNGTTPLVINADANTVTLEEGTRLIGGLDTASNNQLLYNSNGSIRPINHTLIAQNDALATSSATIFLDDYATNYGTGSDIGLKWDQAVFGGVFRFVGADGTSIRFDEGVTLDLLSQASSSDSIELLTLDLVHDNLQASFEAGSFGAALRMDVRGDWQTGSHLNFGTGADDSIGYVVGLHSTSGQGFLSFNDQNTDTIGFTHYSTAASGDANEVSFYSQAEESPLTHAFSGSFTGDHFRADESGTTVATIEAGGEITTAVGLRWIGDGNEITSTGGLLTISDNDLAGSETFQADTLNKEIILPGTICASGDFLTTSSVGEGRVRCKTPAGGIGSNLSSSTDDILSNNGTIRLGGTGGTNNEDLDFDFETTANTVSVSTATGTTLVDFGTINLATDELDLSEGNITNGGIIAVDTVDADGAALALGDNDETVAIDSSDWDISATGAITGVAFDANGAGNSLSNIDDADHTADSITHASIADADQQDSIGVVIETPVDADDFLFWRANEAVTVTSLDCIVENATSAVVVIVECDSAGDNCGTSRMSESLTCDVDGATDDGTIGEAGIVAGAWLRAQVGTVTGTPGHVVVTVAFTHDD